MPAYAHVFTLCPYACNRRQLLLCFCTPVGQFVRLYACMLELLTTVCLYAGIVLVEMPTLLCASVDAYLYVCMPLCLCFCVLCWLAVTFWCVSVPFVLSVCVPVRLNAYVHICLPLEACVSVFYLLFVLRSLQDRKE